MPFVVEVPTAFVAETLTEPLPAGEVTASWVDEVTVTAVAEAVPNLTVVAAVKPVPVIVTAVPPAVGPALGLTPVTVGTEYAKRSAGDVADVPALFVTVISTLPDPPDGAVARKLVPDETVTLEAERVPKWTVDCAVKFVPVTVTTVPDAPPDGEIDATVGTPYPKRSALDVADVPKEVVTVTLTDPALPAGDVAVMEVDELTVTDEEAVDPKSTVVGATKFVPVIVTAVPPEVGPAEGLNELTVGCA